jgi:hypothetical protein
MLPGWRWSSLSVKQWAAQLKKLEEELSYENGMVVWMHNRVWVEKMVDLWMSLCVFFSCMLTSCIWSPFVPLMVYPAALYWTEFVVGLLIRLALSPKTLKKVLCALATLCFEQDTKISTLLSIQDTGADF